MFYKLLVINLMGHILCKGVPQVILVNNMLLPSNPKYPSYDALAEYTFSEGDLVHVTCAHPRSVGKKCKLKMDYKDTIKYQIPDTTYKFAPSENPIGFQLRMHAENDNTHAICTCDDRKVRVNFFKRKVPMANPINVYINDTALRPTTTGSDTYEYQYKPNDHLNVTCDSRTADKINLNWITPPHSEIKDKASSPYVELKNNTEVFYCATKIENIEVKLIPRNLTEPNSGCWMQGQLQHPNASVNPSLELYEDKARTFIYEYEENTKFILTCKGYCSQGYFIMDLFDGAGHKVTYNQSNEHVEEGNETKIFTKNIDVSEITMLSNFINNVIQCRLMEKKSEDVLMVRTFVFERHVPRTTTTARTTSSAAATSETASESSAVGVTELPSNDENSGNQTNEYNQDEDENKWLKPTVISVISIVMICVSTIMYKMKKRKNDRPNPQWQPGEVNYENLPNDSPIPHFPRQWETEYAEPVDRAADPTYSEPSTGPRANIKNELYTLPVPKSRRAPANNHTTDPTYEELDRPTIVQNTTDDPNYAEIVPSAFKNQLNLIYARVLPKGERQNLNKNDYDNAKQDNRNYAQVVPKSMRGKERDGASGNLQGAGGSKYVNVHDGRYVNANANKESEYAEPAYCEPTHFNK